MYDLSRPLFLLSSPVSITQNASFVFPSYIETITSFVEHVGYTRPRVWVQLYPTLLKRLRVCWPLLHCYLRDVSLITIHFTQVSRCYTPSQVPDPSLTVTFIYAIRASSSLAVPIGIKSSRCSPPLTKPTRAGMSRYTTTTLMPWRVIFTTKTGVIMSTNRSSIPTNSPSVTTWVTLWLGRKT